MYDRNASGQGLLATGLDKISSISFKLNKGEICFTKFVGLRL